MQLSLALFALWAVGVPGPDSTAVLAAQGDAESVALAARYARARGLPEAHVCAMRTPATEDITLDVFQREVVGGLGTCLGARAAQIEALVLTRGLPLRVVVPLPGGGGTRVSLAAALALGESATSTGTPILGQAPGRLVNCGGGAMCLGARWNNPFRSGTFRAGWSLRQGGLVWRPRLVTMLHGRSAADAARLIASATTAEALGGARGTFMFMDGADGARGVLDSTYDGVMRGLRALGFTDVVRVPFQGELEGQSLAAFFVGTAGLGRTIEGNRFAPGALVDNLTSFGAVAENFRPSGEQSQVSIARWVAQGVAGVHGTTDEPLNNCFPSRELVVSYAEGGTLGEAYFRAMPFVYWHNLVLGDPMAAPYAVRPRVRLEGLADDDVVVGSRRVTATAEDPLGRTLDALVLYVDGEERARSAGEPFSVCLEAGRHVLAVAQVADERTLETRHRPKGWAVAQRLTVEPGPRGCLEPDAGTAPDDVGVSLDTGAEADARTLDADPPPPLDAQVGPDAGVVADATVPSELEDAGCGCSTTSTPGGLAGVLLIGMMALSSAGRRHAPHRGARTTPPIR